MSKLIYPLISTQVKELYKCRCTLLEMLDDSGFTEDIRSHPKLKPNASIEEFEREIKKIRDIQLTNQGNEVNSQQHMEHPFMDSSQTDDDMAMANLVCLHNNMEWCLFLYAKQRASDDTFTCSHVFQSHFAPWLKEAQEMENKNNWADFPIPKTPKDILVVFCRQERLLRDVHEAFLWYLSKYDISDGVIITNAGATPKIAKQCLTQQEPNLRVFKAKSQLFYNTIRYHQDVPLYRRLNKGEIDVLEAKYGSRQHFPKLWRSGLVAQYYGFRTGDVVLVQPTLKQFPLKKTIQEHLDDPQCFIEQLKFCLVIEK